MTRKSHNCAGNAFVQGDSAGGSKLIEQILTIRTYNIYHNLTYKSRYLIYVMECVLCNLQYVEKFEWPMNIRLNSHRNDVGREDVIPAIKHFSQPDYHFNSHAIFTLIEQINDFNKSRRNQKDT